MKLQNSIGWCDETINAVTGCDKVSAGCKNCYAEVGTRARVLRGQGIETWGPNGVRHPVNFEPVFQRLNKLCICNCCGEALPIGEAHMNHRHGTVIPTFRRIRLFADSNSDWLDEMWPIETLTKFLDAIRLAPNVDVLLLTKRIGNFQKRLGEIAIKGDDFGMWLLAWLGFNQPPQNLWIGVSVEDQERAEERIPDLLYTPAAVRFLSCEPLLENIDLRHLSADDAMPVHYNALTGENWSDQPLPKIDWVIVGLESGKNRRDGGVDALVSVAKQCQAAGVPVYVKQDCAFKSGQQGRIPREIWQLKQFPNIHSVPVAVRTPQA